MDQANPKYFHWISSFLLLEFQKIDLHMPKGRIFLMTDSIEDFRSPVKGSLDLKDLYGQIYW